MKEKESQSKLKLKLDNSSFPTTKPKDNIIRVTCPSCNEPSEMEHINIHDKIAKCGSCAAVFSFEEEVKTLMQSKEKIQEENIVRPAGIEKSYFHDELELSMTQPTGGVWILLTFFCAFFAGLFYLLHVSKGMPLLFPIGSLGIALFSLYKYLNRENEKIFLIVDDNYLSKQYRPKYFMKDKMIPTQNIEQLYIKTLGANYFQLYAITNSREGQKHEKLLSYINNRNKARYLEREIEQHLGIEDVRVPEEQIIPTTNSQNGF